MESGRFQEYILSLFRHTGIESAKYTGDTHRLFHIANHQITVGQRTFHTIERHKLGTFRRRAYHDFITFDLIGIERVQRLSYAVQDIVRDIHHVINGTQADHLQTVLQPFRTFLYSYIFNRNTWIAQTGFFIFNDNFDSRNFIINLESIHTRTFQVGRLTVLFQVSGQVASYTEMRSGIHTVRRDINFQHIIALHIIIFFGRSTDYRIGRQYDYTCMICSNTDFIFSTNHTVRFNATDFRALDRKALITIIQFSTVYSNNHFLSGSYIRRTTNNLQGFRAANIHGCNVQVIGIRMFFASKNFTDDKSFQSTFDGLNFFYPSGFQTNRGKCCCYFIRL